MQVGDEPNVRGAHRQLAAGMVVRPQNAWPSLHRDVKAANQLVGRFLGAGFYYKTFIKPQRLWPAYQKVLSRFAAGGRVADQPPEDRFDQRYAHVDVCVAGGGPAGMAAAIAAAEAGARVLLVEEEYRLGGHLRYGDHGRARGARRAAPSASPPRATRGHHERRRRRPLRRQLAVRRGAPAGPRVRAARQDPRPRLVVAAGLIERPYVFEGNDEPGVMLSTAVRRLVNLWAVRAG